MDANTIVRKRKSERLTEAELQILKGYRAGFQTEVDCAISIGIDRTVLGRVILAGSGSPETIEKVRKVLQQDAGGSY
ncbi:MAG TPA: hypothetical protein VGN00_14010 [Puia sp.]|jgi:hypothetical protein